MEEDHEQVNDLLAQIESYYMPLITTKKTELNVVKKQAIENKTALE